MLPCDCVSAGQVPLLSRLVFRAAAIGVQASTYQTSGGGMTAYHSQLTNWRLPLLVSVQMCASRELSDAWALFTCDQSLKHPPGCR